MREKKYANVLISDQEKEELKHFKNETEDKSDESVKKLSMTRELKFKELQKVVDEISPEEYKKELNEDYDLTDTKERKIIQKKFEKFTDIDENENKTIKDRDEENEDLMMPKEKNSKRIVGAYAKKVEIEEEPVEETKKAKEKKTKEDDIYLTTAFKPFKKRFKISNFIKSTIITIIIAGIIFSIVWFLILPIYRLYIGSQPQMIYQNSIDYVTKYLNEQVDSVLTNNDYIYLGTEYKMEYTGQNDELKYLNGLNSGFSLGIDSNKKVVETSIYRTNPEKKGYRIILSNESMYYNLIGTNDYYKESIKEDDYNEISSSFQEIVDLLDKDDLHYVINKYSSIIKEIVSEQEIEAKKDTIEVRGEKINVVRNTIKINEETSKNILKKYIDLVVSDNRLIKILSKYNNQSEKEIIENLEKMLNENLEKTGSINLYTKNGIDVVGFDIEKDGFRILYYYKNIDGDFEAFLNLTNRCEEDLECLDERRVFNLIGIKNSDSYQLRIKFNETEIATLTIKDFNSKSLYLDYDININDQRVNGTIEINKNDLNDESKFSLIINNNNNKYQINGTINRTTNNTIGLINNETIITDSKEFNDIYEEYISKMTEDEVNGIILFKEIINNITS